MITIFNRKKLFTDTSSMELARVTDLLRENQIKYEVITKRDRSTLSNMVHANMTASVGHGAAASYNQVNGPVYYVYSVYVHKNDYERAKTLIDN